MANVSGVNDVLELKQGDPALSFLPLCHAFERQVAYVYFATGVSMVFAESLETIARDLQIVRPTVMTGVPRVFEKLHARVVASGRQAGGLKRAIFDWAAGVASARGRELPSRGRVSPWLALQSRLADRLSPEGGRASGPPLPWSRRCRSDITLLRFARAGLTETAPVRVMLLRAVRGAPCRRTERAGWRNP
jgi:long-subunit acyl-CoA synthetase (AMP-forming)